ncbi:hypothetical protein FQN57_002322 [Myotisia sp. PD_48]|nr:hypothetical protein FQN57_002322 [Myotisia sp. PD_48]
MSDGFNEARALRVTEIVNDFRTLLHHISQLKVDASESQEQGSGYMIMRQCAAEAPALLNAQFSIQSAQAQSDPEYEKVQLQRIIVDASARRFQAHRIYLKIAAARRWALNRTQILKNQKPSQRRTDALAALETTLRDELSSVTDNYVMRDLLSADVRAGYWLTEDPTLSTILNWIRSQS